MIPDQVQPTVIVLAIAVNFVVALLLSAAYATRRSRWLAERTAAAWFLLVIALATAFLFWHRTNAFPFGPDITDIIRLVLISACAAIPTWWLVTLVRGGAE